MKHILKSKTFWVNAVATVVALGNIEWIAANPQLTAIISAATFLANIALRYVTETAVYVMRGR